MRILGIIPARGGSKQIKKKNLRLLNGKPLIFYTINAALNSKFLNNIVVSTDDKKIADTAKVCGIDVDNYRPKKFSSDYSSTWSVINYELKRIEKKGKRYDFVMMLQPTTPFRSSELIDKACKKVIQNPNLDSVVSIVNVGGNHPFRMYYKNKSNILKPFVDKITDPMLARQLLPPVFIRSGDIYLTKRECIYEKKSLIGDLSMGIEISSEKAVNIDTQHDFIVAQHIMKN